VVVLREGAALKQTNNIGVMKIVGSDRSEGSGKDIQWVDERRS
jgi:hypothetical protein